MYRNMNSVFKISNNDCYSNDNPYVQNTQPKINVTLENICIKNRPSKNMNEMFYFHNKQTVHSKVISLIHKFRYCQLPLNNYIKYIKFLKDSGLSRKLIKKTVYLYKRRIKKSDLSDHIKQKALKIIKYGRHFLDSKFKMCNSKLDITANTKATDKYKFIKLLIIFKYKKLPLMNYVKLRKRLDSLVVDRKKIKEVVLMYKKRIKNSNICSLGKKKLYMPLN